MNLPHPHFRRRISTVNLKLTEQSTFKILRSNKTLNFKPQNSEQRTIIKYRVTYKHQVSSSTLKPVGYTNRPARSLEPHKPPLYPSHGHPLKDKGKAVPLHAMEALGGRGGIAPTHSRPRH
jgi:hypothetical protein